MSVYVGLDVSMKETAICVIDEAGERVWAGQARTDPDMIADALAQRAPGAVKIGMETGPFAVWLWHALTARGLPVVCLHARHAAAALKLQMNKTDRNDAYGLARLVRSGWYRPVAVRSLETHVPSLSRGGPLHPTQSAPSQAGLALPAGPAGGGRTQRGLGHGLAESDRLMMSTIDSSRGRSRRGSQNT